MNQQVPTVLGDDARTSPNPFQQDLSFIDFETSGLAPEYHEIIEVGLVRVHQPSYELVTEFEAKLVLEHPERFSAKAQEVNGYTPEAWALALPRRNALAFLMELMKNSIPVSFKIDFDSPFLYHALKRAGLLAVDAGTPWYYAFCAMARSYDELYGELPKLRGKLVAEHLGLPPEPEPHSALKGARQARDIFRELHRRRYGAQA